MRSTTRVLNILDKIIMLEKYISWFEPLQFQLRDINRIPIRIKVATGTYILQAMRAKFNRIDYNNITAICRLCNLKSEDLTHFLLECEALEPARESLLNVIQSRYSELLMHFKIDKRIDILTLTPFCKAWLVKNWEIKFAVLLTVT